MLNDLLHWLKEKCNLLNKSEYKKKPQFLKFGTCPREKSSATFLGGKSWFAFITLGLIFGVVSLNPL